MSGLIAAHNRERNSLANLLLLRCYSIATDRYWIAAWNRPILNRYKPCSIYRLNVATATNQVPAHLVYRYARV